jgi:hypothetical protein
MLETVFFFQNVVCLFFSLSLVRLLTDSVKISLYLSKKKSETVAYFPLIKISLILVWLDECARATRIYINESIRLNPTDKKLLFWL